MTALFHGLDYQIPAEIAVLEAEGARAEWWHNDACPRYVLDIGTVTLNLWVEHPDRDLRDSGMPHRFAVNLSRDGEPWEERLPPAWDDCETDEIVETDDINEAIARFVEAAGVCHAAHRGTDMTHYTLTATETP